MTSPDTSIHVDGIGKQYRLGSAGLGSLREFLSAGRRQDRELLWALRDVSFEAARGEIVGVIGRNGSGKSTLLKILARVTNPTEGRAVIAGEVATLLEVGTGFHPDLSGRDNIALNAAVLGMSSRQLAARFDEIVEFSGVSAFLDTPVKRYSSGMYVRLAFAVAAHLDPDVLLVDEVLAVGDHEFQKKCLGRMDEVAKSGRTVIFVSHDMAAVSALCSRGLVLESGRLTFDGAVEAAVTHYLNRSPAGAVQLEDRTERAGAGGVRFVRVWIVGKDGRVASEVRTGEDLTIAMDLDTAVPAGAVEVAVAIRDHRGMHVTDLWSATDPGALAEVEDGVAVTVPRLPLNAGRYALSVQVSTNGVVQDAMDAVLTFDVTRGDFFGPGKVPTTGAVVVDQRWRPRPGGAQG